MDETMKPVSMSLLDSYQRSILKITLLSRPVAIFKMIGSSAHLLPEKRSKLLIRF